MNLWQVAFHDPSEGLCLYWKTSELEAQIKLDSLIKERSEAGLEAQGVEQIKLISIPTHNKRALAEWLNIHFNRDNG